jgi:hypothetical protein
MVTLNRAHRELYRRGPDESFQTLPELHDFCRQQRRSSSDVWQLPQSLQPLALEGELSLTLESQDRVRLIDWSFTQLCRLAGVSKDTLNAAHGVVQLRAQSAHAIDDALLGTECEIDKQTRLADPLPEWLEIVLEIQHLQGVVVLQLAVAVGTVDK